MHTYICIMLLINTANAHTHIYIYVSVHSSCLTFDVCAYASSCERVSACIYVQIWCLTSSRIFALQKFPAASLKLCPCTIQNDLKRNNTFHNIGCESWIPSANLINYVHNSVRNSIQKNAFFLKKMLLRIQRESTPSTGNSRLTTRADVLVVQNQKWALVRS